jgi:S1-C subfamily serine protease
MPECACSAILRVQAAVVIHAVTPFSGVSKAVGVRREILYSSSGRRQGEGDTSRHAGRRADTARPAGAPTLRTKAPEKPSAGAAPAPPAAPRPSGWRAWLRRHDQPVLLFTGALVAAIIVAGYATLTPHDSPLTQEDIDKAVLNTLQKTTLPSPAVKAYEIIRPSVVRVRRLVTSEDGKKEAETSVGTGVVIVEDGTILTNIHVVADAERIGVIFADGTQSDATIIATQPEQDLAVIKPKVVPDDLFPATLRSSNTLKPGEHVFAVGNPFGIGPSLSAGVVSGLKRQYESPEGKRILSNLIQFDTAVNPGNSGGPLVTAEGEVVGIVTGLLNPSGARTFAGIGFAVPIESAAGAVGMSPF